VFWVLRIPRQSVLRMKLDFSIFQKDLVGLLDFLDSSWFWILDFWLKVFWEWIWRNLESGMPQGSLVFWKQKSLWNTGKSCCALLCANAHPTLVGDLKELWRNLELIIPSDIIIQILLLFLADLLCNFEELLPSLFLRRGICALKFLRRGKCALKFLEGT